MNNQDHQAQTENQENTKENNFRALEAKYQRQLAEEKAARLEAEKRAEESSRLISSQIQSEEEDEEDDSDPYVDNKKLKKKLSRHSQKIKQDTQAEIENAVSAAITKEKQENWIKSNEDFYDVMAHAEKFYAHDPEWAETILRTKPSFERNVIVYKSIKNLGLHEEKKPDTSVQDKINMNRRTPYYQPNSVGSAPMTSPQGDFSPEGQKKAYEKFMDAKNRMRLG